MPESTTPLRPDAVLLRRLTDLLAAPAPPWQEAEALVKGIPPDDAATRAEAEPRLRMYEVLRGRPHGQGAPGWLTRPRGALARWPEVAKSPALWLALTVLAGLLVGAFGLPRAGPGTPRAVPDLDAVPERVGSLLQFRYPAKRYNLGQHKKLHVVPARAAVRVDGDLSDWDLSGTFRSGCDGTEARRFRRGLPRGRRRPWLHAGVRDPVAIAEGHRAAGQQRDGALLERALERRGRRGLEGQAD
jgi:hypothetical protein